MKLAFSSNIYSAVRLVDENTLEQTYGDHCNLKRFSWLLWTVELVQSFYPTISCPQIWTNDSQQSLNQDEPLQSALQVQYGHMGYFSTISSSAE